MITQLLFPVLPSIMCAWCNRRVDLAHTEQIAVCEDPLDINLVTGYERVCVQCLEACIAPLEIEVA